MAKARIYMVRHGQAAAGWADDADPDLSDVGRAQAAQVADEISALLPAPVPIVSSPLLRCRSTAAPLAARWQQTPRIEPRVAELPSPMPDLQARTVWLRRVMQGSWEDFYADSETAAKADVFKRWHADVIAALYESVGHELTGAGDVVVFSHFIALNVAYDAAQNTGGNTGGNTEGNTAGGGGQVVAFRPDNASLTIFESDGKSLYLYAKGREAETQVN